MIGPLGAKTHARPVVEPEPAAFRLLLRDLQPFPSPYPLNPLAFTD